MIMAVTVKELIFMLSEYEPETIVSVDGYEGGVTDDVGLLFGDFYLHVNDQPYIYGEHEPVHYKLSSSHDKADIASRVVITHYYDV